jgi:hypothetical protein
MTAGDRIDELGADAYPIPCLANAAFQDVVNSQFARDLLDIARLSLERKRRVTGDHKEVAIARQLRCDVLGDGVGEVVLVGIAAYVIERQHGDGRLRRKRQNIAFRIYLA